MEKSAWEMGDQEEPPLPPEGDLAQGLGNFIMVYSDLLGFQHEVGSSCFSESREKKDWCVCLWFPSWPTPSLLLPVLERTLVQMSILSTASAGYTENEQQNGLIAETSFKVS